MKPLVIFDIDGTLAATINVDDECFSQTFRDLYNIDLGAIDWQEFNHVTDLGVTRQIFQDQFDRHPTEDQITSARDHLLDLFRGRYAENPTEFQEVTGAAEFFDHLFRNDVPLAIATGGWQETALFKLEKIGVNIGNIPFSNSNQHYSRSEIMQLAIASAREKYGESFDRIVYFGDGEWDLAACRAMGIEFVGVDFYRNDKLKSLGVEVVIEDFTDREGLLELI
ncbi:MAG: HAD family hydrolase [Pyrinomonadaceae bacterium]|nr:HAD family hydrolase [Pyrinomonadaceae bacterium]